MLSLIDRIEATAERDYGLVTFVSGDDHQTIRWSQLHSEARVVAAALQARGVQPGDHVAVLGPTTRQLITTIQAIWLTGAALVTMPLPMRMGALEQFVAQTRVRIHRSDTKILVIDSDLAGFIEREEGDPPFVTLDELFANQGVTEAGYRRPKSSEDSLAVLQFTSGSTSEPKGVMLSHEAICNNLDGAWKAAAITRDEVIVSWLPLYHDMGLVGLLTIPMTIGCTLVQGAPQDFGFLNTAERVRPGRTSRTHSQREQCGGQRRILTCRICASGSTGPSRLTPKPFAASLLPVKNSGCHPKARSPHSVWPRSA